MVKSIIKEIIIVLLLLVAIVLGLGILFYDYIPANKTVPILETYSTSEVITRELNDQITKEQSVLVTYEITAADLKTYEKKGQYEKGKENPFSTYLTETSETNDENDVTNTSSINGNTTTNTTKGSTFFNSTGTK